MPLTLHNALDNLPVYNEAGLPAHRRINVPKDQFGIAYRHTKQQGAALSALIQKNLYDIIKQIFSNQKVVKEKRVKAPQKIKEEHDPQDRADSLQRIYEEALR